MMDQENRPHPDMGLPVMVTPVPQTSIRMYDDPLDSLYHGSLYSELYKPMRGFGHLPEPHRADMEKALDFEWQDFMLWFDTHCLSEDAQAQLQCMKQKAPQHGRAAELLKVCEQRMEALRAAETR